MMLKRVVRPVLLTGLLVLAAWVFARSPLPVVSAQSQVVGSGPYRAGLIVRFNDGRVESRCVRFEDQEISGLELLDQAKISDLVIAPDGAVCGIGGQGCPSDDCFCQCPFPNCEYWAYFHRDTDAWSYAQEGAAFAVIRDGSLDGWSWGPGTFGSSGVEPPQRSFADICPADSNDAATMTPTATLTPSATPTTGSGGGGPTSAPEVSFFAAAASVSAGQCTTLTWLTGGATSVTLDSGAVDLQGSQEVCPRAAQTWTLTATNAAGQTTRQVSVAVQGGNPNDPTATRSAAGGVATASTTSVGRAATATRAAVLTPVVGTPRQFATPPQLATAASPFPLATPGLDAGGVPFAPTAQIDLAAPAPAAVETPTPFAFSLPPTETPRPTRTIDPNEPTPTPILVARVDAKAASGGASVGSGAASNGLTSSGGSASSSATQTVKSRSFSPDLLPGYAAYVVSVAALLIVGWYVLRHRHA